MSATIDIPLDRDVVPQALGAAAEIRFRCCTGISCFNACCRQAAITPRQQMQYDNDRDEA